MPQSIREVMTADPVTLSAATTLVDAARRMKDESIGDVLVADGNEQLRGVVTDRDIVVRAVAEGLDTASATLGDVCSGQLVTLAPTDAVGDAVRLMSERAVRRLPVVENGQAVGIVAMGDLALERDPHTALADISAAAPNT
jgi:signal-transduction protein with cAMP-binding, CBS, and nucleotidyltransferase domain